MAICWSLPTAEWAFVLNGFGRFYCLKLQTPAETNLLSDATAIITPDSCSEAVGGPCTWDSIGGMSPLLYRSCH